MGKGFDKFLNMIRLNDEEYDEYDDYDDFDDEFEDDFDDIPAPVVKKKSFKKENSESKRETKTASKPVVKKSAKPETSYRSVPSSSRGKIVPMKSAASRGEVCVLRPTAFEDSREISDVLLSGRAAVINLEGIDLKLAQRIIDFISGSCYAMAGNIEKISNYIFIVTPESIEISGDIQEVISSGINIPSFNSDF